MRRQEYGISPLLAYCEPSEVLTWSQSLAVTRCATALQSAAVDAFVGPSAPTHAVWARQPTLAHLEPFAVFSVTSAISLGVSKCSTTLNATWIKALSRLPWAQVHCNLTTTVALSISWTSFALGASGIMSTYRRLRSAVTSRLGRAQYSRPYLVCLFQ